MSLTGSGGRPWILVASLLLLAGCESLPTVPAEERAVSELVDRWNDAKYNPAAVAGLYAKGAVPPADQLKQYRRYTISMTNRPSIGGAELTIPIEVSKLTGKTQEVKTLDWTLVKEGESWKIKAGPLP